MSKEAMNLALEALESCTPEDTSTSHVIYAWYDEELVNKAIKALEEALEEALAKQEQGEPVAITITGKLGNIFSFTGDYSLKKGDKVYTTPQQRKPLTDEERKQMWHKANPAHKSWASFDWYSQGVADTEAAHGIKE